MLSGEAGRTLRAMGLIERLTAAGQQATASARETLEETQLRRDLARAYDDLGRTTSELIQRGALRDDRLARAARRIGELEARLAALASYDDASGNASAKGSTK